MMRRRGTILVILSLALGGVAAWAANTWVHERLMPTENEVVTHLAVAAAMSIPLGTVIEPRHLRLIRLPEGTAPDGYYSNTADLEGKVATTSIARGEVLIPERFAQHAGGSTLAALLSPNMRAVTIRVDDVVGVAGFLLPGNRVDVLASRQKQQNGETRVETILRHIKVLAIDQTASTERNDPIIVRAVTLELTPDQSEVLFKAREEGKIQLALRNPADVVAAADPAPEPAQEPAPPPAPVPVAAPPRPRPPANSTITIIRGTKVETERTRT
jgi:pilus assembly protein CpaB